MALPVPATVDTVLANPTTTAGVVESSGSQDACTITALPTPTANAVAHRPPPIRWPAYRLAEAMKTPTMLLESERTHPLTPPPTKKNDAHVKKTTQIGTVMTSAVKATASPPSTPMLSGNADRESMMSSVQQSYFRPHCRTVTARLLS